MNGALDFCGASIWSCYQQGAQKFGQLGRVDRARGICFGRDRAWRDGLLIRRLRFGVGVFDQAEEFGVSGVDAE
jgi:hypothetical protein